MKKRWMLLCAISVALWCVRSVPGFADAPATEAPAKVQRPSLVGAIRWDAWTEWEKYKSFLYPAEWHYRLPFYAKVAADGTVEIRGDRPEVMAQELRFAHQAGIDYWAWCWYDPTTTEATEWHMNDILELYRKSPERDLVNYCLIGPGYYATQHWEDTVERFVAMFKEPNYQKVLGNRPLFYHFSSQDAVPHFRSVEVARQSIDYLREKTIEAGLDTPYIVGLCFWPDKGAQAAKDCGFDAIGSYCNPPAAENRELAYSEMAGLNRWFWNACKETGQQVVPPVNAGWDPRPRRALEEVHDEGNWCVGPTPEELQQHVAGALDWVANNRDSCEPNTILIYAWNEFDEGGWICPNLSEGSAKLDAVGRAVRAREPVPEEIEDEE